MFTGCIVYVSVWGDGEIRSPTFAERVRFAAADLVKLQIADCLGVAVRFDIEHVGRDPRAVRVRGAA